MAGRVVLFGATGFTGRLTAAAMARRGLEPILAGRSEEKLRNLARDIGAEFELARADAGDQGSLERLLAPGDVLVSTVGPFTRFGDAAVGAATASGAHYVDSNGEPPFTRRVFEHFASAAEEAGVALLPAFGWENVVGNLAAGLALEDAGADAALIDVGYFYLGRTRFSAGTRTSFTEAMIRPSFAYRGGRVRTVRGAERFRTMQVNGRERAAVSLGASEHLSLPRAHPALREVNAYLGWFGGLPAATARPLHLLSAPGFALLRLAAVRRLVSAVIPRLGWSSDDGPSPDQRRTARVLGVAIAYDGAGREISEARVEGPEGYELTAELLALGAQLASEGLINGRGALGPVEALGIRELEERCRGCGLARVSEHERMKPLC